MNAARPQAFSARNSAADLQFLEDLHALRQLEGSLDMLEAVNTQRPALHSSAARLSEIARRVLTR
jgi:hypothetical protein